MGIISNYHSMKCTVEKNVCVALFRNFSKVAVTFTRMLIGWIYQPVSSFRRYMALWGSVGRRVTLLSKARTKLKRHVTPSVMEGCLSPWGGGSQHLPISLVVVCVCVRIIWQKGLQLSRQVSQPFVSMGVYGCVCACLSGACVTHTHSEEGLVIVKVSQRPP